MHSPPTCAYHYTYERLDVDQDGRRLREPESMNTSRIWTCMNQQVPSLTLQIVNAAHPQELCVNELKDSLVHMPWYLVCALLPDPARLAEFAGNAGHQPDDGGLMESYIRLQPRYTLFREAVYMVYPHPNTPRIQLLPWASSDCDGDLTCPPCSDRV